MRIRRTAGVAAAFAATLLGGVPGAQLHAAAVTTDVGAGPAILQASTPSSTVDCSTTYTFTGTAVMVIHGPAGTYSGPVAIQGTMERCGADIQSRTAQFTVTGSAEFGDFGCGTPSSPMQGWWIPVVADLIVGAGTCHVAGATVAGTSQFDFNATAPSVPTSIDTSSLGYTSFTDAGLAQWSAP